MLPLKPLAAHFLLADTARHAAYEQAVADGVARQTMEGGLKMVDREQLARVLGERKLALESSLERQPASQPDAKPIVAADILVVSMLVTEESHAWVRIHAYHAATASLLGWMRLPVDPARPEEPFIAEVAERVSAWWPGVLVNLESARNRPVVTLMPVAADRPDDRVGARLLGAALAEGLERDRRIFLAEYVDLPAAQQELLMKLLGLSRPTGGRYTPAADLVVDARLGQDGSLALRLLSGRDLSPRSQTVLSGKSLAEPANRWLGEQLGRLAAGRGAIPASRNEAGSTTLPDGPGCPLTRPQAQLELDRAAALRKEYDQFRQQAYERYRQKDQADYLPDDAEKMAQMRQEIDRHVQRAAQLDPSYEQAACESARAKCGSSKGLARGYAGMAAAAEAAGQFVDSFPRSKHVGEMHWNAVFYHHELARFLEDKTLREFNQVPPGIDFKQAAIEHRRLCLHYLALHIDRRLNVGDESSGYSFEAFMSIGYHTLPQYEAMGVSDEEMERVIAEYGRAADGQAEKVKHSDFFRLKFCAARDQKEPFQRVLAAMQKRWPDPKDKRWDLIRDETVTLISDFYRIDRRGSGFYRWSRGLGPAGELP